MLFKKALQKKFLFNTTVEIRRYDVSHDDVYVIKRMLSVSLLVIMKEIKITLQIARISRS